MNKDEAIKVLRDALERVCDHSKRYSEQINVDWDAAREVLAATSSIEPEVASADSGVLKAQFVELLTNNTSLGKQRVSDLSEVMTTFASVHCAQQVAAALVNYIPVGMANKAVADVQGECDDLRAQLAASQGMLVTLANGNSYSLQAIEDALAARIEPAEPVQVDSQHCILAADKILKLYFQPISGFDLKNAIAEAVREAIKTNPCAAPQPVAQPASSIPDTWQNWWFSHAVDERKEMLREDIFDLTKKAFFAGAATTAPVDPMDWPLPCDVTVGCGTNRKGTTLRTLVARMNVLHGMAMKSQPAPSIPDDMLMRTEAIRMANANPSNMSRSDLISGMECLLAHIAITAAPKQNDGGE